MSSSVCMSFIAFLFSVRPGHRLATEKAKSGRRMTIGKIVIRKNPPKNLGLFPFHYDDMTIRCFPGKVSIERYQN